MTDFRGPVTDAEWEAYHAIRRHVLFEQRGLGATYDPNHPDERLPGHYPLVFWNDEAPVAVIRVDIANGTATFRRVAVREDLQRRGLGRRLLTAAEQFARAHGCVRIDSYVDPGAVGFYERCGFSHVTEPRTRAAAVLMTKSLGETR